MGVQAAAVLAAVEDAVASLVQAGSAALERKRVLRIVQPAANVRALSARALEHGGTVVPHPIRGLDGPQVIRWDIAGDCEAPQQVEIEGQGHFEDLAFLKQGNPEPVWFPLRRLSMAVRCRQCEPCLRARRRLWMARAVNEFHLASRVWFGTLTFRPEVRYRLLLQARQRLAWGGLPPEPGRKPMLVLEQMKPREQFAELHREAGKLVTNYMKAIRKGRARKGYPATRFRYLLVVEPHQDWFPHYHALFYEVSELMPLRKSSLEDLWEHGFTKWKLARDPRACSYAAKYLGKFAMARVRASVNFGGESASQSLQGRMTF